MNPLAQFFGVAAVTTAILAWPLAACLSLGACFMLVVLAAYQPPRLP